ncbi:hypothetical protein VTO73DRAFT_12974 [Trametes versicolor]
MTPPKARTVDAESLRLVLPFQRVGSLSPSPLPTPSAICVPTQRTRAACPQPSDVEGRSVLCNAVYYRSTALKQIALFDLATPTGSIDSAVIANRNLLWDERQETLRAQSDPDGLRARRCTAAFKLSLESRVAGAEPATLCTHLNIAGSMELPLRLPS